MVNAAQTKEAIKTMRTCGSCTKCCEGWVAGQARDSHFYPGVPCDYLADNGCSIYKSRPEHPCQSFVCEWLVDRSISYYMKPDKSCIILIRRKINDIEYVEMAEAGQPLSASALEWFLRAYISGKYDNISYRIHNHPRYIGTAEFITAMEKQQ